MTKRRPDPEVTLAGILTALEWDQDNKVTGIQLAVDGEEVYVIGKNSLHDSLIQQLRKVVQCTGTVQRDPRGRKQLSVRTYRVMD